MSTFINTTDDNDNSKCTNFVSFFCPNEQCKEILVKAKVAYLPNEKITSLLKQIDLPPLPNYISKDININAHDNSNMSPLHLTNAIQNVIDKKVQSGYVSVNSQTESKSKVSDEIPFSNQTIQTWWIIDDLMYFENMGFTRILPHHHSFLYSYNKSIESSNHGKLNINVDKNSTLRNVDLSSHNNMVGDDQCIPDFMRDARFLCCAVCELGPLGISFKSDQGMKYAIVENRIMTK